MIVVVHWWLKWKADGHWLELSLLVTLVPSGVNQEFIIELLIPQIGLVIPLTRDWCSNAIKTFPTQCIIIRKNYKDCACPDNRDRRSTSDYKGIFMCYGQKTSNRKLNFYLIWIDHIKISCLDSTTRYPCYFLSKLFYLSM